MSIPKLSIHPFFLHILSHLINTNSGGSMQETYDLLIKLFFGFFALLILTRLNGKKQLGQLNIFTYITGIVIGSIVAETAMRKDITLLNGIIAITAWTVLTFIIEYISLKSGKLRAVLDGEPTIVIKRGKIQYKALKKMRLNIDDLSMLLRTNNVFSIKDVDYAVLEPNGDLSILKIQAKEQATKKDMKIQLENIKYIPSEIISDGKIVYKNLKELNKTEKWVHEELKRMNIDDVKDVLYAEVQTDGELYIQVK